MRWLKCIVIFRLQHHYTLCYFYCQYFFEIFFYFFHMYIFTYVYVHICVRAYARIKKFWEGEGGNIGIFLIPGKIKVGIGLIFLFKAFFYFISIIYPLLNKKPLESKFTPLKLILSINNIKRFIFIFVLIKNN